MKTNYESETNLPDLTRRDDSLPQRKVRRRSRSRHIYSRSVKEFLFTPDGSCATSSTMCRSFHS
jgi:hypothetical protein